MEAIAHTFFSYCTWLGWWGSIHHGYEALVFFLVFALFLSQFPFEITNFSLVQRYRYFLSFTLKG